MELNGVRFDKVDAFLVVLLIVGLSITSVGVLSRADVVRPLGAPIKSTYPNGGKHTPNFFNFGEKIELRMETSTDFGDSTTVWIGQQALDEGGGAPPHVARPTLTYRGKTDEGYNLYVGTVTISKDDLYMDHNRVTFLWPKLKDGDPIAGGYWTYGVLNGNKGYFTVDGERIDQKDKIYVKDSTVKLEYHVEEGVIPDNIWFEFDPMVGDEIKESFDPGVPIKSYTLEEQGDLSLHYMVCDGKLRYDAGSTFIMVENKEEISNSILFDYDTTKGFVKVEGVHANPDEKFKFGKDETIELKAVPKENYEFVKWVAHPEGNMSKIKWTSTSNPHEFGISKDIVVDVMFSSVEDKAPSEKEPQGSLLLIVLGGVLSSVSGAGLVGSRYGII